MNYATSSGAKTVNSQIAALPGAIYGFDLVPPNAGSVTLTVYDSENNIIAGKKLLFEAVLTSTSTSLHKNMIPPTTVDRGIFCKLAYAGGGTTSTYFIRYSLG